MTAAACAIGFVLGYALCAFVHFYRLFIRHVARFAVEQTIAFEVTAIGWDGLAEKLREDSIKRAIKDLIDESQ